MKNKKRSFLSSTDKKTFAMFWQTAKHHKRELWLISLFFVGAVFISTVAPYATSNIIASLTKPGAEIKPYIYLLVISGVLGVIANRIGMSATMRLSAKANKELQDKTLHMLLNRSTNFHANNVSGKLVSDAIDYPRAYMQVQNTFVIDLVPFLVSVILGVIVISIHSLALGFIIFIMSAFVMLWAWIQSLHRSDIRSERRNAQRDVTAHIGDIITNVIAVKSFANESHELKVNDKLSKKLLNLRIRDWVQVGVEGSNRHAALLTIQFLLVMYLVHMTRQNPDMLGIGIFAFSYSVSMTNRLFQVGTIIRSIEEGLIEAAPMTEYLSQAIEITDPEDAQELQVHNATITLDKVNFRYGDSNSTDMVFSDLSIDIKPGERIGIVGPSGGGKSTLMKLLLRFEDATSGTIKIDNQDISQITQTSLRQAISYVPQEPLLFHRSIAQNIAYGNPGATLDDIRAAAKRANADEFIADLPMGYDTIVGERGVKLSGGQRQRIAIARAILKNAPILLLDEATSALDSESEKYIQAALTELMKGKTTIVIAHRLSTINQLDKILVIEKGSIVEQGSHKQLLETSGLYATLWAHQSGGFLEEE